MQADGQNGGLGGGKRKINCRARAILVRRFMRERACFRKNIEKRVTGDCVAMGEAAGILAAESLQSAVPLRKLDVKAVLAGRRKG